MSGEKQIPALHQAIVAAAVKAALGERAIVRQIVEQSPPGMGDHVYALGHGIRTFWRSWTGRQTNGSSITDETTD
jgi:hypothetical protein